MFSTVVWPASTDTHAVLSSCSKDSEIISAVESVMCSNKVLTAYPLSMGEMFTEGCLHSRLWILTSNLTVEVEELAFYPECSLMEKS